MVVSIHQPQYLSWLGYFSKIDRCDKFVLLDNVQFKKNEWQNRNRIKTAEGWQWITVPVLHKFLQKISDVEINNTVQWGKKHLNALVTNYSKAPFYNEYIGFFEQTYSQEWKYLADINIHIIHYLVKALGISDTELVMASSLESREGPTERLIDLCKQLGGDEYLSGKDGAKYMDLEEFEKEGVGVIFQDYKYPQYPQLFGSFEPYMSILDLLFNCGSESLSILRKGE